MTIMMKRTLTALFMGALCLSPVAVYAKGDAVQTSWRDNLSADGYDVVSFFSGKPQKGKVEFATVYKGAVWQFFSQANMDLFLTNPEQFSPQYGGYCAWAVAKGKLAKGDPEHWYVEDGSLYFNYNARIQRRWEKKRGTLIKKADAIWPTLID